jgi:antitoxin VapB
MDTAKLFMNGRSQAVRLPKQYALPGNEVYVKKMGNIVLLIPKDDNPWQPLLDSLEMFSDDVFNFKRDQGKFERRAKVK